MDTSSCLLSRSLRRWDGGVLNVGVGVRCFVRSVLEGLWWLIEGEVALRSVWMLEHFSFSFTVLSLVVSRVVDHVISE